MTTPNLGIGTRVTHRRYGWMVGLVTGQASQDRVSVMWDSDRYWNEVPCLEDTSDLRPTPHQPFPVQP